MKPGGDNRSVFQQAAPFFNFVLFRRKRDRLQYSTRPLLPLSPLLNIGDVMEVCVLFSPRSDLTLRSVEKANKAILGAIAAAGEDSALTSLLGFHTAGDHEERQPSASELVSRCNHGKMKG